MRKNIIAEIITTVVVWAVFLLAFSVLNGWSAIGQDRCIIAILSSMPAVIGMLIVALIIGNIDASICIDAIASVALFAVLASESFIAALAVNNFATVIFLIITIFCIFAAIVSAVTITNAIIAFCGYSISKKHLFISLGVEGLAIFTFITAITFSGGLG